MFYFKNHQNCYLCLERKAWTIYYYLSVSKFKKVICYLQPCRNFFLKNIALIDVTCGNKWTLMNLCTIVAYFEVNFCWSFFVRKAMQKKCWQYIASKAKWHKLHTHCDLEWNAAFCKVWDYFTGNPSSCSR